MLTTRCDNCFGSGWDWYPYTKNEPCKPCGGSGQRPVEGPEEAPAVVQVRDARYHRMKANQAWDLAGLARQDGDRRDERRWTREARAHDALVRELA